ncbi:hypothetical protein RFI_29061, partial [Reticulomyxa filosa]
MLDQILRELDNAYFEGIIKPNQISGCCPSSEAQLMSFADATKNNQFVIPVGYSYMWVVSKGTPSQILENCVKEWVEEDLKTVEMTNRNNREEWVNIFKYLDTKMSAYDTRHMVCCCRCCFCNKLLNEWRLSENFRCAAHWWAKRRLADKLHKLCEQHFTTQTEELEAEQILGWNRFNNRVKGLETDVQLGDHI